MLKLSFFLPSVSPPLKGALALRRRAAFESCEVPKQPFLLAEEGDLTARRERSWDGVFGFGRTKPISGGPSLHEKLRKEGKSAVCATSLSSFMTTC